MNHLVEIVKLFVFAMKIVYFFIHLYYFVFIIKKKPNTGKQYNVTFWTNLDGPLGPLEAVTRYKINLIYFDNLGNLVKVAMQSLNQRCWYFGTN